MSTPISNEPKGIDLKGKSFREGMRLTPDLLKSHIAEVIYEDREVGGHRVITCHFKMDNGFVVWGKNSSTSIDPANFDEELGKKMAYDKTFSQLWELEAYRAVVEKQMLEVSTAEAKIDINQYISERGNILQMSGAEFLKGHKQSFLFRHPKDPSRGFSAVFVQTNNEQYNERSNDQSRVAVEVYLRSFMTVEELNSEFVIRLAKTCYAAYVGITGDQRGWFDLKDQERKKICAEVKELLLKPKGGLDKRLTANDRMYKSIVDSYK